MLITTTPTVEGQRVLHYRGLVTGEAIIGANLFRDLLASMRDMIGGRSRAYEEALETARQAATDEMVLRAKAKNANAVIGVDLDYEVLTEHQEPETRRLIGHLGLEWDEVCLSPQDNNRSVSTASNAQIRQKVYRGSSEKWKRYTPYLNGALDHLSGSDNVA